MKILAVEFSSAQRSVAVWETGGTAGPPSLLGGALELPAPRIQNSKFTIQTSMGLVEKSLAQAGCRREEIGAVAVGLGPGSYNGIRGAIALAQGWQLGRDIRLLGLGSAGSLAAQAGAEGWRGPANIIIDAQRNEFYLARWQIGETACREEQPLRLATMAEIQALAAAGLPLLGPDIARWFGGAKEMYPSAVMLGRLACARLDFVPGESLEPIYLRETAFKKAPPPRINP